MAEVLFNKLFLVGFILFIQAESFFFLCYSPLIFLTKTLKLTNATQFKNFSVVSNTNTIYFGILFFLFFFIKSVNSKFDFILLLLILFLFTVNIFFQKISNNLNYNNTIYLVLPSFGLFTVLLFFVDSFLTLFFFIELYGVLYYFCFLTSYGFTSQTVLKYKNGLLMLLWNNFLTTFFLALGCFFIIREAGTSNFTELIFVNESFVGCFLFLFGLFWKLGLPVFHFFKLEVYKYLLKENIFLFSILTTLVNLLLFYVCFTQVVVFSAIYSINILSIILVFSILLILTNIKVVNFLQFFAFSGVFTLTTVLTVFLI